MKYKKQMFCFILAFLLYVSFLSGVSYAETDSKDEPAYDGYIVKLKDDLVMPHRLTEGGGLEKIAYTEGCYLAENISDAQNIIDAGLAEYIEPNYILKPMEEGSSTGDIDTDAPLTDDGLLYEQWALEMIDFASLYKSGYNGSGVKVAIIDSGVFLGHEDLENVNIAGYNFLGNSEIDGVTEAYTRDQTGHGTFVTGLVASQCNNGKGIAGMADGVDIILLRCFSGSKDLNYPYDTDYDSGSGSVAVIISALGYALEQGADVINMSFGGNATQLSKSLSEAIQNAADSGAILVASAGNAGGTTYYWPASFDSVVSVGMVNSLGFVADQSQHNDALDVTAPGFDVISLDNDGTSDYTRGSGTSYSTPIVSAFAAIVKQVDPEIDTYGFLALLPSIVNDDASEDGYDVYYGHGIVDAGKLLIALSAENNICYELNGGSLTGIYSNTYTINRSSDVILPIPTRDEYAFEGWYKYADFSGDAVISVPAGSVGTLTYYAKWTESEGIIPEVADGQGEQIGSAVPASYDNLTTAVIYNGDMDNWFENETGYAVETCSGFGKAEINGTILTYLPSAADANTNITISVRAFNELNKSIDTVNVKIAVGELPPSNSVIPECIAEYDLFTGGDLQISLLLYGNTVLSLKINETLLTENIDYVVTSHDIIAEETVTLKESCLSGLSTGNYTLTFTYSAGNTDTSVVNLNVIDSTPSGSSGGSFTGGGSGGGGSSGDYIIQDTINTYDEDAYNADDITNVLAGTTAGSVLPFSDISPGAWYYDAVEYVWKAGLFSGTSDTLFEPAKTMERSMLVTVLWRLAGKPDTSTENPFTDIEDGTYYYDAVLWAYENNIISGYGNDIFGTGDPVTREQMVTILWRYAQFAELTVHGHKVLDEKYTDAADISKWAEAAFGWAVDAGIVSGTSATTLSPKDTATRAEMAVILSRYCMTIGEK